MIRALFVFTWVPVMAQATYPIVGGAGYRGPALTFVAPCQLLTIYTNIDSSSNSATAGSLPLPLTLAGISAQVGVLASNFSVLTYDAPILEVFQAVVAYSLNTGALVQFTEPAATIQIPCEIPFPAGGVNLLLSGASNPGRGAALRLFANPDAIHIIRSGDSLELKASAGFLPNDLPSVLHADGSAVTSKNPSHPGETVSVWAVGLGLPSSGTVKTGEANPSPALTTTVNVDFDFRSNAGPSMPSATDTGGSRVPARKVTAYFAPGFVGLYQINVTIPAPPVPLEPCGGVYQSNLTINIGGSASFDGAGICVAP